MTRILSVFKTLNLMGFAVLLLGGSVFAQDSLGIRRVSTFEYWQSVDDMVMRGNTLFARNHGSALYIMDVSNPTHPVEIGRCPLYDRGDSGGGIDIVGNLAFIGFHNGGLVYDISDPTRPLRITEWVDLGGTSGILVAGDYAVANGGAEGTPYVLDVSDIYNIHRIAHFPDIPGEGWPLGVVGDYLFMTGRGLMVYDMTDPHAPVLVAQADSNFFGRFGTISGNYAYFCPQYPFGADTGGVRIIDISNPLTPFTVATCDSGECMAITVTGDLLVVSHTNYLSVWNISNPVSPIFQGEYGIDSEFAGASFGSGRNWMVSSDNFVCVTTEYTDSLVAIVDISSPTLPVKIGSVGKFGYIQDMTVSGSTGYLAANTTRGIVTFDFSNPSTPVLLGESNLTRRLTLDRIAAKDDYAYGTTSYHGLIIFDARNSAAPESLGVAPQSAANASDILVEGDYAYAITESLVTMDIQDPGNPLVTNALPFPQFTRLRYTVIANGYLYGQISDRTLQIYSLSTPSTPVLVGTIGLHPKCWRRYPLSLGCGLGLFVLKFVFNGGHVA